MVAQQRQAVFAAGGIVTAGLLACVLLLASTPRTPTTLLGVMPQPYRYPKVLVAKIWNSARQEISRVSGIPFQGAPYKAVLHRTLPRPKNTLSLSSTPLKISTPPHVHPPQPTPTLKPSRRNAGGGAFKP